MKLDIGSAADDVSLESFVNSLVLAGAGKGTVKLYSAAIKDFLNFVNKDPREVSTSDFNRWMMSLMSRKGKKSKVDEIEEKRAKTVTVRSYAIAVKRYLKWVGKDVKGPLPRIRRREYKALNEKQALALLNAVRGRKGRLAVRLLLDTGIRSNELLSLRVVDVDLDHNLLRLRNTKNGEERVVFFTEETATQLRSYVRGKDPQSRLFDISYQALYKLIRRAGKRCGIEDLRPHILRHTFATMAIKKGIPLPVLQKILGHHDIKTTQIYMHLVNDDAQEIYKKAFG
ncbi:site-specific tyrosine recombinase/integron integrase [Sulfuracidifex tepidarius]|uniref:Tyrosine recombinase XerA n=1 Tax=Sulfuracidifex tepidarius TaxID=1294262 RepID=A0A510DUN5_9CREN|nr:site-specific tyrosine recombinase/integron integrase [Sulfuracidifex tepidarius]BBG23936.1 Tyrosine recombinase XerA [Sulfuracidifex tepidarius]BBG26691.1 Tyrosine recombinase XerA [Sulfuracidifex tepidarius]